MARGGHRLAGWRLRPRIQFLHVGYFRRPVRRLHGRRRPARGPARPGGSGAARGADLRYNMEISLTEAYSGKTAQIRVPTSVSLRNLQGFRRQARHQPEDLHHLQGRRCCTFAIRILHGRARLPHLPGPRPGYFRSLQHLRRPGPRHQGAQPLGQHSARRGRRHPHQACQ